MTDLRNRDDEVQVTPLRGGALTSQTERLRSNGSNLRWIVWAMFAAVIVALLVVGYTGWWYIGKVFPSDSVPTTEVEFTVTDDDTIETVTNRLYDEGLISDIGVFEWYVERQGGLELTPGFYEIPSGAHMGDVVERLQTPPAQTYHRVTFPEGFTIAQMGERLAEDDGRMSATAFDTVATDGTVTSKYSPPDQPSLEGLLFPDTYQISNADNEGQVVERMVGLMERVGDQEDLEIRAAEMGMTPYQVLTVASIIEREAKVDADRPKIARVIYNRLFLNQALEVDATLYYGTPGFEGNFAELREVDSPYNTYLHQGLPPTPIANPGRASIRAALNPTPNPTDRDDICKGLDPKEPCLYLYYVLADADGSHVFAATYEQHEANVAAAAAKGLL